ncbi:type II secretion system protein GspL [Sulfitobacter sp.]|uniref:type II secretion system protein GspL n=1 Tax=Sulfitobacter sp. TaxID=1903071 RepID=UPI003F6BBC49
MKNRPSHNDETLQKGHINKRQTAKIDPDRVGSKRVFEGALNSLPPPSEFTISLCDALAESLDVPPLILPGEKVSLMAAVLPVRGARAKRAALPFALEDRISAPLEDVHIALCRALDEPDLVVAAVVDRNIMQAAVDAGDSAVVPEIFALPTPTSVDEKPVWAVWLSGARALVRVSDGTGFVVDVAMLPLIWAQAAKPLINSYGDVLSETIEVHSYDAHPPKPDPKDLAVDLRQGAFAHKATNWAGYAKRAAMIAAVGAIGHLGIMVADTVALTRIADRERAAVQAAIDTVLPGLIVTRDVEPILRRLAPPVSAPKGSAFLPILGNMSAALLEADTPISFRRLTFADNPARLTMLVEVPGLDDLQQAERLLRAAGFGVTSGAATATAGVAEAEFVVTAGGRE